MNGDADRASKTAPRSTARRLSVAPSPGRLALLSWLFGGPRPPWRTGRTLYLGSGELPLALATHRPDSDVVAVPLLADAAWPVPAALAPDNLQFVEGDVGLLAPGSPADGPFDFILADGVLSWVSLPDRVALLKLAAERLAPEGILYASHCAAPGWRVRSMVRALARRIVEPGAFEDARRFARALREFVPTSEHPYPSLLARELDQLANADDETLRHDYLGAHHHAFWFGEIAELAAEHGLRYVGDAAFNQPGGQTPRALLGRLEELGFDAVDIEDLADVLCFRQVRASMFCRATVPMRDPPGPEIVDELRIACALRGPGSPLPSPGLTETWRTPAGVEVVVGERRLSAALRALEACWPADLSFAELREGTEAQLESTLDAGGAQELRRAIRVLHADGMTELRLGRLAAVDPSRRPRAIELARHEALTRGELTTPMFQILPLGSLERRLVPLLDGTRSRDELARALVEAAARGEATLELDGSPLRDPVLLDSVMRIVVDRAVDELAAHALLEPVDGR